MTRSAWILPLLIITLGLAWAHPPPGDGHRGAHIEQLAADLGLDDTQKAEVQRIFDEERAKHEAEREARRAELRQRLSTVLTAEQLAKFDALRQKRQERHGRRSPDAEQRP